jgi:hypothetical protein
MKKIAIWIALLSCALIQPVISHAQVNKGRPGISPGDSLAAIKQFLTASGSDGLLYRYVDTYVFRQKQKDSTARDTMSVIIADNHNIRSELGLLGMQVIGRGDLPKYSVLLYPQSRTYKLNVMDTAAINAGGKETYRVTKVGNETLQGYHCAHVKLTTSYGKGVEVTEDLWMSTDVPGYAAFKKMATMQQLTPKMLAALEQAGCPGMFVKMQMQNAAFSMSMLLVGADRKSFPGSLFQIPAGYTQAKR